MKRNILLCLLAAFAMSVTIARAQVLLVAELDSTGEGSGSTAGGTAWGVLSADMSKLTYHVTYNRLQGSYTASHFHHSGGVTAISFTGNTSSGEWTGLTDANIRDLLRGTVYVNVHSTVAPGGEIRGFLKPVEGVGFTVSLDGTQAGTTSTGTGTAWAVIDSSSARIRWNATVSGLSARTTAAHFHYPTGGVMHATAFTDSTSSGTWSVVPDSIVTMFAKGGVYLNVHTTTNPGGEIRGAVKVAGEVTLVTPLDSTGEGSGSTASGTAWGVLSADMSKLTYHVTYNRLQGSYTASHFHHSGGVTAISFTGNTSSGEWTGLTDANIRDLLRGTVYVNVHSTVAPGGEIRGFLKPAEGIAFTARMDGAQAGTTSTGTGTAWAVIDSSSARIRWNATVSGLSARITAAHFHYPTGGVMHATPFTDSTSSGTWSAVPDSIVTMFAKGGVYLNVHTTTNPGGEIRGAVKVGSGVVTNVKQIADAIPASFALDQNYPNPFNPSTTIQFQLQKAGRVSLKVYNILGEEVATLLEEAKAAGSYAVSFDAGTLASGMYFYRLSSDAGLIETRKMVLLK